MTTKFPKYELYSLGDQMRRVASSITSNIAEGFGRYSYKDKLRFYYLSQGSLIELKNQILIAKDVGHLQTEDFTDLVELANRTHALLQGLIQKTRSIIKNEE